MYFVTGYSLGWLQFGAPQTSMILTDIIEVKLHLTEYQNNAQIRQPLEYNIKSMEMYKYILNIEKYSEQLDCYYKVIRWADENGICQSMKIPL